MTTTTVFPFRPVGRFLLGACRSGSRATHTVALQRQHQARLTARCRGRSPLACGTKAFSMIGDFSGWDGGVPKGFRNPLFSSA